jgi:hypothetical protein
MPYEFSSVAAGLVAQRARVSWGYKVTCGDAPRRGPGKNFFTEVTYLTLHHTQPS